jgi:hypothetical protein
MLLDLTHAVSATSMDVIKRAVRFMVLPHQPGSRAMSHEIARDYGQSLGGSHGDSVSVGYKSTLSSVSTGSSSYLARQP